MRSNLDECDEFYTMEIEMNRDYFARPIQGSRSSYDYGKSGPIEPLKEDAVPNWPCAFKWALIVAIPVYVALWAVWTSLP